MLSIREIADDKSSISSTRWAFASVIKFDIFVIFLIVVVFVVGHFLDKPLDISIFGGVATLLGVPTGFIATSKALQGFEPYKKKNETETKPEEIAIDKIITE